MKNWIILLLCVLSFAAGMYLQYHIADTRKGPDREAEIKALVGQLEESKKSEFFHKFRADRAEHAADSIKNLKPKIIIRYYEKDHSLTILNADSSHKLLLSNAATDSIWR